MFNIVLYEPEIPPNTGNIIRLASNTGARLHLIQPLGFTLDDKKLRRAGLDYHEFSQLNVYADWQDFLKQQHNPRLFAVSTRGSTTHSTPTYQANDYFVFGPETRGLPQALLEADEIYGCIRLPMQANSRSLNLSNSVAVVVYEAWRQIGFTGGQ